MAEIDTLFRTMLEQGASDMHLLQGQPPKLREHGHVNPIEGQGPLDGEFLGRILKEICPAQRWRAYSSNGDTDFAYALGAEARFRANYYRQSTGHAAVFRVIPTEILTLEQLKAPEILRRLSELHMGLVLVTGPTGSGKSTTLAAMLDHLNSHFARKVLTLEDPIEFVHPIKRSVFVQREVHEHTDSFASGLRAALREDCDVILVGEMRDLETIALALSAAETGALVFGTLHTNSAAKTIDRIVNVFPADQQKQVTSMLSTSLRAVVSQQLLRTADGKGRVAAHEILVNNDATRAAIREGQIAKLNQAIQTGRRDGMVTMDDALMALVEAGTVAPRDAYLKALDKKRFEALLGEDNPFS
jgi:twitching motility protein PilT